MRKMTGLIAWMIYSALGALAGDEVKARHVPVEMGLKNMEISCKESGGEDEQAPLPVKLSFALNFGVSEPFDLNGKGNMEDQSLEAEDSTGKKLGAVTFDVGNLHTWKRGQKKVTLFKGVCPELPSPEAEWIRLHGTFRLPMTRDVSSPVYDFSLSEGRTSFPVTIAEPEEDPQDSVGDLVVAGETEEDELSVRVTWRGKERLVVRIMLWNDKGYRISSWELMDGDGKPLKADDCGDVISGDPNRPGTGKDMDMDVKTDLSKLKIKLYYRQNLGTVSLPVDMKMGLGGTIRE